MTPFTDTLIRRLSSQLWLALRLCLTAALALLLLSPAVYAASAASNFTTEPCFIPGLSRHAQCYVLHRPLNAEPATTGKLADSAQINSPADTITDSSTGTSTSTDARLVALGGIIAPAQASTAAADPLVVLVGGPGQGASDLTATVLPMLNALRNSRDIIFFDIRGTGRSAPLPCDSDFEPPPLTQLPSGRIANHIEQCLASAGDITSYTSMNAVADLEALRLAINAPQLNLWAVSYGTRLAQLYMRSYPQQVRSAVLDAVVPFSPSYIERQPANALKALNTVVSDCAASTHCSNAFPDFNPLQLLDSLPELQSISYRHPVTGLVIDTVTSRGAVAQLVFSALYQSQTRALIPWALSQAASEDNWQPLAALGLDNAHYLGIKTLYQGAHYAVVCSGELRRNPLPPTAAASDPFFRDYASQLMKTICADWPVTADVELLPPANPAAASIPVLMLSGALDPITPPSMAASTALEFANNRHLIIARGGHMNSAKNCVRELIDDFIDDPDATLAQQQFAQRCEQQNYQQPFIVNRLGAIVHERRHD